MNRLATLLIAAVPLWTSNPAFTQNQPAPATAPVPLVQDSIRPLHITRRPDGVFFIDFGREAFGNLELNFTAGEALPSNALPPGTKITIRLGEKTADASHLDRKPGGSLRFLETAITTEAGKNTYRPQLTAADARLMPANIGGVMPFRYAELENLPAAITADQLAGAIRQMAAHYAFDDAAADFISADEKLNAVWNFCKYSIKATSFAGRFIDGDRERKPYEADAYLNQLGWYYTTTDITLPRSSHEYLITHPTWPTEWIMFSVFTAWLDYQYTGDPASLKAHYDDLKAKTLRALERDDGLISTVQPAVPQAVNRAIHFTGTLKDIVDWPEAERDGYKMQPFNTVVNAFHVRALSEMGDLAAAAGKPEDAADFRNASQRTLASLNSKMVNARTGLYLDGIGTDHSALLANAFPLAFGLVPEERRAKVADFVQSRGMACSVYGAQFLLDALFSNGHGAQALALITAPGDRSWRHMIEETGLTITPEAWDPKYKPNEDWNHAWGAAPANLIPRMILGVEPLEPGYKKALIWPRCAGIEAAKMLPWARGKVPTVQGSLAVDWKQSATGFRLAVELPAQCTALVRLPLDWGDQATLDAQPAKTQKQTNTIEIELPAGKHILSVGH